MSQSVQCFGKKKNAVRANAAVAAALSTDNTAGGSQPLQEGKGNHQGQRQAVVSG